MTYDNDFTYNSHFATKDDNDLLTYAHPIAYPLLKRACSGVAIKRIPKLGVIAPDPVLLRQILTDKEHFSKVGKNVSSELWTPVIGESGLLNMDGLEHARLRKLLSPLFTPKRMSALVDEQLKDYYETSLQSNAPIDIVQLTERANARIICHLTGLDTTTMTEDEIMIRMSKVTEMTRYVSLTHTKLTRKEIKKIRNALSFLQEDTITAYRSNEPSLPQQLREAGLPLETALSVIGALMVAGTETLNSFLPRMTALVLKTNLLPFLQQKPELIPATLDESLRVTVPTPIMLRSVIKPVTVENVSLKEGERVILPTVVACHRAGDFNPFQKAPAAYHHLWFGAGGHFCLGMSLALAHSRLLLETLIQTQSQQQPLQILSESPQRKTLTARYERLIIGNG